jgi:hypothetical protein
MTCLAPAGDGFFDEPSFGVMLREEVGLSVHQLGIMGFEGRGDPGMELPSRPAQQGAVGRILDQGVLEQVFGCGRRPALKDQTGIDEALERLLDPFFGEIAD